MNATTLAVHVTICLTLFGAGYIARKNYFLGMVLLFVGSTILTYAYPLPN